MAEVSKAFLTSKRQDYMTPPEFMASLAGEFSFVLDIAASAKSAQAPRFYTEADDAFTQDWAEDAKAGAYFCNPPYSDKPTPDRPGSRPLSDWIFRAWWFRRKATGSGVVAQAGHSLRRGSRCRRPHPLPGPGHGEEAEGQAREQGHGRGGRGRQRQFPGQQARHLWPRLRPGSATLTQVEGCQVMQKKKYWKGLTWQERLWSRVGVSEDGCWEWTGPVIRNGYAMLRVFGRKEMAHRMAYADRVGGVPRHLHVLHKCDNRRCCRPDHLFLGTQQDNMNDMKMKGRQAKGASLSAKISGDLSGRRKLSSKEVGEIRAILKSGLLTQRKIAKKYGVCQQTISCINTGYSWSHGGKGRRCR
jgi:hypothetical protein